MKNLKKVLALVLALATVMGLGVTASAKEYSDADSIKYTEAVDVMSAVGVLDGNPDGTFAPTKELTRAQAAKMVTYILNSGVDVNELYSGACKFTDCYSNWARGYIAYANQAGIISGVGNGKFNPNGTLTGVALAKMMLCSLGYDAKVEGYQNNDSWMVNVLSDAKKAGLLNGLDMVNMYKAITREEASQMMFNALKANMVEYDSKGTEIDLGNGSITIGATAAKPVTVSTNNGGNGWANNIDKTVDAKDSSNALVQLGEQYLRGLNRNTTQNDAFNRPASVWTITKNGVSNTIGVYTDTPVLTYTTEVKQDVLYKDLGLDSMKYTIDVYVDGAHTYGDLNGDGKYDDTAVGGVTDSLYALAKNATVSTAGTANGVLTEIFTSVSGDTTNITISQIHNYVGEVVAVNDATATNPRSVTIAGYTTAAGKFETDGFAKGDIVSYTLSKKNSPATVESATLTTQVKGKMTSYVGTVTGSVTVDGNAYKYNTDVKDMADGAVLNKDVTLYLDPYGYVLNIGGVVASTQYAYMLKYNPNGGIYGKDKVAQLLMADGTIVDAQVKAVINGGDMNSWTTRTTGAVSYTVDSNGKYTLTGVDATNDTGYVSMTKGSGTITIEKAPDRSNVYANGNTVVLVKTGTTADPIYTAYTGIANMPSITSGTSGQATAVARGAAGVAELIFVDAIGATVSTSSDQAAYILHNENVGLTKDSDGEYYIYKGVVDGEIKDIKVDATLKSSLFAGAANNTGVAVSNLNFNEKGIAVSFSSSNAVNNAKGATAVKNNVIGLGSGAYSYSNDCVVFYVDTNKDAQVITSSTITGLLTDASDNVKFVCDTNNTVVAVFVEKVVTNGVDVSDIKINNDSWSSGTPGSLTVSAPAGSKAELNVVMAAGSENATVSVKGLPVAFPASGETGPVLVTVTITAEDGSATATYTLNVTLSAT